MDPLVAGFWGVFFGAVGLMLIGYARPRDKVPLRAPATNPSNAVTMTRAMSHTAWSDGRRIAWFDRNKREIAGLPLTDGRR